VNDIKKAAKNGNEATAKTLAKQLVRLRAQKDKLTAMHAQVGGVSVRATVRPAAFTVRGLWRWGGSQSVHCQWCVAPCRRPRRA